MVRSFLNFKTLKQFAKDSGFPIEVEETPDYLIWKFKGSPDVYISKKDWRLYAEGNSQGHQYAAWYLLRRLSKYGYVEGYKRTEQRRKFKAPYRGYKYIQTSD